VRCRARTADTGAVGSRYSYCASCSTLWGVDAPETCPGCAQPLLTGSVHAAYCADCAVSWHPGGTATCWVCGGAGVLAPGLREWENEPGSSVFVAASRFAVGSRRSPVEDVDRRSAA
jgi:hypothetical protein